MNKPNYGNMYAKHGHDHDLVYSKHTHNHDNEYSKIYHNHDGVYAGKSHNHDGTYSPTSHNHDGTYLPLTGGTVSGDIRAPYFRVGDTQYVRFGYETSTGDTFIANGANSWLRLKEDKSITYAGKSVLINQGRQTLWSGTFLMNDVQQVTPSKALSDCQNGWVMVWGDFDTSTSTANDYNYVFHYIHKNSYLASKNSLWICSTDGGDNLDVTKKLYITNTYIKGHADNSTTTKQCDVVLRYIMEW